MNIFGTKIRPMDTSKDSVRLNTVPVDESLSIKLQGKSSNESSHSIRRMMNWTKENNNDSNNNSSSSSSSTTAVGITQSNDNTNSVNNAKQQPIVGGTVQRQSSSQSLFGINMNWKISLPSFRTPSIMGLGSEYGNYINNSDGNNSNRSNRSSSCYSMTSSNDNRSQYSSHSTNITNFNPSDDESCSLVFKSEVELTEAVRSKNPILALAAIENIKMICRSYKVKAKLGKCDIAPLLVGLLNTHRTSRHRIMNQGQTRFTEKYSLKDSKQSNKQMDVYSHPRCNAAPNYDDDIDNVNSSSSSGSSNSGNGCTTTISNNNSSNNSSTRTDMNGSTRTSTSRLVIKILDAMSEFVKNDNENKTRLGQAGICTEIVEILKQEMSRVLSNEYDDNTTLCDGLNNENDGSNQSISCAVAIPNALEHQSSAMGLPDPKVIEATLILVYNLANKIVALPIDRNSVREGNAHYSKRRCGNGSNTGNDSPNMNTSANANSNSSSNHSYRRSGRKMKERENSKESLKADSECSDKSKSSVESGRSRESSDSNLGINTISSLSASPSVPFSSTEQQPVSSSTMILVEEDFTNKLSSTQTAYSLPLPVPLDLDSSSRPRGMKKMGSHSLLSTPTSTTIINVISTEIQQQGQQDLDITLSEHERLVKTAVSSPDTSIKQVSRDRLIYRQYGCGSGPSSLSSVKEGDDKNDHSNSNTTSSNNSNTSSSSNNTILPNKILFCRAGGSLCLKHILEYYSKHGLMLTSLLNACCKAIGSLAALPNISAILGDLGIPSLLLDLLAKKFIALRESNGLNGSSLKSFHCASDSISANVSSDVMDSKDGNTEDTNSVSKRLVATDSDNNLIINCLWAVVSLTSDIAAGNRERITIAIGSSSTAASSECCTMLLETLQHYWKLFLSNMADDTPKHSLVSGIVPIPVSVPISVPVSVPVNTNTNTVGKDTKVRRNSKNHVPASASKPMSPATSKRITKEQNEKVNAKVVAEAAVEEIIYYCCWALANICTSVYDSGTISRTLLPNTINASASAPLIACTIANIRTITETNHGAGVITLKNIVDWEYRQTQSGGHTGNPNHSRTTTAVRGAKVKAKVILDAIDNLQSL